MKPTDLLYIAHLLYGNLDPDHRWTADLVVKGEYRGLKTDGHPAEPLDYYSRISPTMTTYVDYAANVGELIRIAQAEILAEETKKSGNKTRIKAIKEVLAYPIKMTKKTPIPQYTRFTTTYSNGRYQYISDGYRIYKFVEICAEAPICKNEVETKEFIRLMENNLACRDHIERKEEQPDLAKLKAYIKRKQAEKKAAGLKDKHIAYCFGDVAFDAEYLVHLMETLPNSEWYTIPASMTNKHKCPLYARDTEGNEAYILPCMFKEDEEYTKTEL